MRIIFFGIFSTLLSFTFYTPIALANAPEIHVQADPNPVAEDDSVLLRIEVKIEGTETVGSPNFSAPDFQIVGKNSSLSTSVQIVNGTQTMERVHEYSFVLYPKKSGLLKVQNIEVPIGGTNYKADSVLITVRPAAGGNANPPTPQNNNATPSEEDEDNTNKNLGSIRINSDFTIVAHLSKTTAYVGEPIVVEYYLYEHGNVTNLSINKWPTFTGFWKEDLEIPTRFQFRDTYINNQQMRRALLARFALYPLKPGKIPLDKLVVEATFFTNRGHGANPFADDPFFSGFLQMRSQSKAMHASQELTINVLPLPENGRPSDYTGAVGKFSIAMNADKTQTIANKPVTVTLSISGTGNFHAIESPNVKFPNDFELYESSNSTQNKGSIGSSVPLQNKKDFRYLVIPRKAGNFQVPALTWNYFDPEKKTYNTLSTNPISIEVQADTNAPPTPDNPSTNIIRPGVPTQEQQPVKKDLRYLKPLNEVLMPHYKYLYNPIRLLLALFAVLNLLLLTLLLLKKIPIWYSAWQKPSDIKEILKKELKKLVIVRTTKNKESFYSAMEKFIHIVLDHFLQQSSLGMTREELHNKWEQRGLPKTILEQTLQLMNICEQARYATNINSDHTEKTFGDKEIASIQELIKKI